MTRSSSWTSSLSSALIVCAAIATIDAQSTRTPTARLVSASRFALPGEVDSSNPAVWSLVDGAQRLFVISSWGGVPTRASGSSLSALHAEGPVGFITHPGNGVWMEAIVPDESGAWYGYYHHERPADLCGRPDRQLPRIGAMRSTDQGRTWEDLGIVIDAPPDSEACDSANRFVLGGIGDVTAALDRDGQDLYLYFSQIRTQPAFRKASPWRGSPGPIATRRSGKVTSGTTARGCQRPDVGRHRLGYIRPGHRSSRQANPFTTIDERRRVLGPSIHWNTYLEQYVMLAQSREGRSIQSGGHLRLVLADTFATAGWSAPVKLRSGGKWYPQVIGEEAGSRTDRPPGGARDSS